MPTSKCEFSEKELNAILSDVGLDKEKKALPKPQFLKKNYMLISLIFLGMTLFLSTTWLSVQIYFLRKELQVFSKAVRESSAKVPPFAQEFPKNEIIEPANLIPSLAPKAFS